MWGVKMKMIWQKISDDGYGTKVLEDEQKRIRNWNYSEGVVWGEYQAEGYWKVMGLGKVRLQRLKYTKRQRT